MAYPFLEVLVVGFLVANGMVLLISNKEYRVSEERVSLINCARCNRLYRHDPLPLLPFPLLPICSTECEKKLKFDTCLECDKQFIRLTKNIRKTCSRECMIERQKK
jgi:hypothetical protein